MLSDPPMRVSFVEPHAARGDHVTQSDGQDSRSKLSADESATSMADAQDQLLKNEGLILQKSKQPAKQSEMDLSPEERDTLKRIQQDGRPWVLEAPALSGILAEIPADKILETANLVAPVLARPAPPKAAKAVTADAKGPTARGPQKSKGPQKGKGGIELEKESDTTESEVATTEPQKASAGAGPNAKSDEGEEKLLASVDQPMPAKEPEGDVPMTSNSEDVLVHTDENPETAVRPAEEGAADARTIDDPKPESPVKSSSGPISDGAEADRSLEKSNPPEGDVAAEDAESSGTDQPNEESTEASTDPQTDMMSDGPKSSPQRRRVSSKLESRTSSAGKGRRCGRSTEATNEDESSSAEHAKPKKRARRGEGAQEDPDHTEEESEAGKTKRRRKSSRAASQTPSASQPSPEQDCRHVLEDLPVEWRGPLENLTKTTMQWKHHVGREGRKVANGGVWISGAAEGPFSTARDLCSLVESHLGKYNGVYEPGHINESRGSARQAFVLKSSRASVQSRKSTSRRYSQGAEISERLLELGCPKCVQLRSDKEWFQVIPIDIIARQVSSHIRHLARSSGKFPAYVFAPDSYLCQYAPSTSMMLGTIRSPSKTLQGLVRSLSDPNLDDILDQLNTVYQEYFSSYRPRKRDPSLPTFKLDLPTSKLIFELCDQLDEVIDRLRKVKFPATKDEIPSKKIVKGEVIASSIEGKIIGRSSAALRERILSYYGIPPLILVSLMDENPDVPDSSCTVKEAHDASYVSESEKPEPSKVDGPFVKNSPKSELPSDEPATKSYGQGPEMADSSQQSKPEDAAMTSESQSEESSAIIFSVPKELEALIEKEEKEFLEEGMSQYFLDLSITPEQESWLLSRIAGSPATSATASPSLASDSPLRNESMSSPTEDADPAQTLPATPASLRLLQQIIRRSFERGLMGATSDKSAEANLRIDFKYIEGHRILLTLTALRDIDPNQDLLVEWPNMDMVTWESLCS